jgi:hypothetical protein
MVLFRHVFIEACPDFTAVLQDDVKNVVFCERKMDKEPCFRRLYRVPLDSPDSPNLYPRDTMHATHCGKSQLLLLFLRHASH